MHVSDQEQDGEHEANRTKLKQTEARYLLDCDRRLPESEVTRMDDDGDVEEG